MEQKGSSLIPGTSTDTKPTKQKRPMTTAEAAAESGGGGSSCDFCEEARALVYCRADSARLCLACDRHVHAANAVCSRHPRSLLCDACRSAPSSILLCSSASSSPHPRLLCPNCDFDALHAQGGASRARERRPVEPYSGCPTASEMLALLGVPEENEKSVPLGADEGSTLLLAEEGWVWETPPILSMDDLMVPINAHHGFQATGVPPPPKDRNASCGRHKDEILRQLGGLVKSEVSVSNDFGLLAAEIGFVPRLARQLGTMISIVENDAALVVAASPQAKVLHNCCETDGVLPFPSEHQFETSMEEINTIIDGPVGAHVSANDPGSWHLMSGEDPASLPPKFGYKLSGLDRDTVLSRYKEKRKTRRYEKQIRYESRKLRADGRIRIKGRFARVNQNAKS